LFDHGLIQWRIERKWFSGTPPVKGHQSVFPENDLYMLGVPRKIRDFTGCQCHPLNAANLATVAIASAIGDV
jgi:hypothetical protein